MSPTGEPHIEGFYRETIPDRWSKIVSYKLTVRAILYFVNRSFCSSCKYQANDDIARASMLTVFDDCQQQCWRITGVTTTTIVNWESNEAATGLITEWRERGEHGQKNVWKRREHLVVFIVIHNSVNNHSGDSLDSSIPLLLDQRVQTEKHCFWSKQTSSVFSLSFSSLSPSVIHSSIQRRIQKGKRH